jgi:hypothetical protein
MLLAIRLLLPYVARALASGSIPNAGTGEPILSHLL